MKEPNPKTDSQCGHEYIISFFIVPYTSLCIPFVTSGDSLFVFSKVIDCLQYGHFAICLSLLCVFLSLTPLNRLIPKLNGAG